LLRQVFRPPSIYKDWEEPAQEGAPFDYDAEPRNFYFQVESAGNLEPDAIVQQSIKVLQQKLAAVIQDLTDGDHGTNGINGGGFDAPQSPEYQQNGNAWEQPGYTTPYANGNGSAWGAAGNGAATPYGATPYGQNGGY